MARRAAQDSLWKDYFRDPSKWWDNRCSKLGPAYPDFKHKVTKESLWINGCNNSHWVSDELRRRGLDQAPHVDDIESAAFVTLLRACTKNKDLSRGIRVHDDIIKKGLLQKCSDALVSMYAKCGDLMKAKELFDNHKSRDVFTWTALIAGCVNKGQAEDALSYYDLMQSECLSPDAATFVSALKACGSLGAANKGEEIHDEIAKQALLGRNAVLGSALVDMYAKCGALEKARQVLAKLPVRNVVSWTSLIGGYAQQGEGEQALKCFEQLQEEGLSPDALTYTCVLKACGGMKAAEKGEKIHDEISKHGLLRKDIMLGNALVDMYAKSGAIEKAQRVLEELPIRDVVSWTSLVAGYMQLDKGEEALNCFEQMCREGVRPNALTFLYFLKACGSIRKADKGRKIHDEIAKLGLLVRDAVLGGALVDMYAKCGALVKARGVLDELPTPDVVCWNALVAGYVQHGNYELALSCYEEMQCKGFSPDSVTFSSILKACGSIGASKKGEELHHRIAKQGLLANDVVLGNALVDMYAKCAVLAKAREVLEGLCVRNVISWNALITGYTERSEGVQALQCYEKMQREGISPNEVTFLCILKTCGNIRACDKGEQVHDEIAKQGLLAKNNVLGNALVDMYVKCSALTKARQVLEELPGRDVVTWTTLITGYVEQGEGGQALDCHEQMQREGLSPSMVTFISILKACGIVGATAKGEKIHDKIVKQGLLRDNKTLGTAVIDMYGKCGDLAKARRALEELPARNAISWTALITGYAQHGQVEQALDCLDLMQDEGLSPDAATLSCILCACSRLGLVEDAQMYFVVMTAKFGIRPDLEHYTVMVDLLGRAGRLDKALGLIEGLPPSNSDIWASLLGACRKWGDVNIGRWTFEQAIHIDKFDAGIYLLMSDIYAEAGMHKDADSIEAMRIKNKAWQKQGHGG